jgi:hypothetical protein
MFIPRPVATQQIRDLNAKVKFVSDEIDIAVTACVTVSTPSSTDECAWTHFGATK